MGGRLSRQIRLSALLVAQQLLDVVDVFGLGIEHVADPAVAHPGLPLLDERPVAAVLGHHVALPGALGRCDDAPAVFDGVRHGDFAQHVPAAVQGFDRLLGMELDRRADDDDVQRRVEKLVEVGVSAAFRHVEVPGRLGQPGLVQVAQRGDLGLGQRGERRRQRRPAAGPHQSHSVLHGFFRICAICVICGSLGVMPYDLLDGVGDLLHVRLRRRSGRRSR